jgi:hypothetical protein
VVVCRGLRIAWVRGDVRKPRGRLFVLSRFSWPSRGSRRSREPRGAAMRRRGLRQGWRPPPSAPSGSTARLSVCQDTAASLYSSGSSGSIVARHGCWGRRQARRRRIMIPETAWKRSGRPPVTVNRRAPRAFAPELIEVFRPGRIGSKPAGLARLGRASQASRGRQRRTAVTTPTMSATAGGRTHAREGHPPRGADGAMRRLYRARMRCRAA